MAKTLWDGSLSKIVASDTTRIPAGNSSMADGYILPEDIYDLLDLSGYAEADDLEDFRTETEIIALIAQYGGGGGSGLYDAFCCVADVKGSSVNGGSVSSGAWQVRDINTEISDPDDICSISGNQVTLSPGTYDCLFRVPAYDVARHQGKLHDVGNSTDLLIGESAFSYAGAHMTSVSAGFGRIVLDSYSVLELWHRVQTSSATYGFGVGVTWGDNIYASACFWRCAS